MAEPRASSFRRLAPWVVLWAAILTPRALVLASNAPLPAPNSELERAAACLADHGYLGNPYPDPTGPTGHVAPAYPAILAVIYSAFGSGTAGHWVQSILTILLTGVGISLLPRLSVALYGAAAPGWVAAFLMALLPLQIGFVQVRGEWEQHVTFLGANLYLALLLDVHAAAWSGARRVIGLGVVTGVLALLNPQFLLAFALFAAVELVVAGNRKRVAVRAALAAVVAVGVILPWTVRNYDVLGGFCLVRSNAGLELAIGNHDEADGRTHGRMRDVPGSPYYRLHPYRSLEQRTRLIRLGELKYMAAREAEAVAWVKSHPVREAELIATRVYLFWLPPPDLWPQNDSTEEFRSYVSSACCCGINAVMTAGLIRLAARDTAKAFVVLAVLLGLSVSYYATHVSARYVFPLHGISLLLAGEVVVRLATAVAGRVRSSTESPS